MDAATVLKYSTAGAVGCIISHSGAVPLDVIKTRVQLDPEKFAGKSTMESAETLVAEEGVGVLQGFVFSEVFQRNEWNPCFIRYFFQIRLGLKPPRARWEQVHSRNRFFPTLDERCDGLIKLRRNIDFLSVDENYPGAGSESLHRSVEIVTYFFCLCSLNCELRPRTSVLHQPSHSLKLPLTGCV
jgi:hypothetical protein